MHADVTFVLLFAVATAVALGVRWLNVPYTVALVATGLLLGSRHLIAVPHLTKTLLYAIFLPGLVFEAAFHLDAKKFVQNKWAVGALAVPGVVVSTVLTAALLVPLTGVFGFDVGFTLRHGLVFGALIAATDPIAVVAMFKSLGAPQRLNVLVEAESLLNDGTAAVLFAVLLELAVGRGSALAGIFDFGRVIIVSVVVGLGLGYLASKLIQLVDDAMIEISTTTIAAYGSFVLAERLGASGLLATVAAGMLCGNYGAHKGMTAGTRIAVETFWEYLAFALNSFVFLLLGFEVPLEALLASWQAIVVAWVAVTAGRAVVVSAMGLLLRKTRERVPRSWLPILVWGGQRGALSMVLALGLPTDFPHRQIIVTMTYGVVTLSILLQGTSMKWLLRRLGVVEESAARLEYDRRHASMRASRAALDALDRLERQHAIHGADAQELRHQYALRLQADAKASAEIRREHPVLATDERRRVQRELLLAEKRALIEAHNESAVGDQAFNHLSGDVDARLQALESGEGPNGSDNSGNKA